MDEHVDALERAPDDTFVPDVTDDRLDVSEPVLQRLEIERAGRDALLAEAPQEVHPEEPRPACDEPGHAASRRTSVILRPGPDPRSDRLAVVPGEDASERRIGRVDEQVREFRFARDDSLEGRSCRRRDADEIVVGLSAPQVEVRIGDWMAGDALAVEDRLHVRREARRAPTRSDDDHESRNHEPRNERSDRDQPSTVRKSETLHCSSTLRKTHGPESAEGLVADQRPGALPALCSSTVIPAFGLTASV